MSKIGNILKKIQVASKQYKWESDSWDTEYVSEDKLLRYYYELVKLFNRRRKPDEQMTLPKTIEDVLEIAPSFGDKITLAE